MGSWSAGVDLDAQRMPGVRLDLVLDVGGEAQYLRPALALHLQGHRDEGRIVDADTDLSTGVTRK